MKALTISGAMFALIAPSILHGAPDVAQTPATDPQHTTVTTLPAVKVRSSAPIVNGPIDFDATAGTASRLGLSVRETPAAVTVIDHATLQQRGARDTQEMLRGVPGVVAASPPARSA